MNVRVFSALLEMDVLNLQNMPVNKYHKTLQSAICNYLYLLMFLRLRADDFAPSEDHLHSHTTTDFLPHLVVEFTFISLSKFHQK